MTSINAQNLGSSDDVSFRSRVQRDRCALGVTLSASFFCVLLFAQPGASQATVERSQAAEERGFAAVDQERWCDAFAAFIEANHFAPSVDLIYNAAQAADLAGDRKHALSLYADLLGANPDSERQGEVNNRLVELTQELQQEGPGELCREPTLATLDGASAAAEAEAGGATDASSGGGARDPSSTEEAETEAGSALSLVGAVLPWTVMGGGAILVVAGATLSTVGVVPFIGHAGARQQIMELEVTRADPSDLQAQQQGYRQAWESWGEPSLWSGLAVVTLGITAAAVGAGWGVVSLLLTGQEASGQEEAPASRGTENDEMAPDDGALQDSAPEDSALGDRSPGAGTAYFLPPTSAETDLEEGFAL